jgi:Patatin-like phospholipase
MLSRFYYAIFILFFLSGCAGVRHAVPANLTDNVQVIGIPYASRAFWGQPNSVITQDYNLSLKQDTNDCFSIDDHGNKTYSVLIISSGAENGAYGSGLLKGWSQSGSRPVFKIVTGTSTGAIMAPFAFLGSAYDRRLEEIYTTHSTKDVFRSKIIPWDSLVRNWPLEHLIKKYFDKQLLQEIAKEYYKGRRLYIGTTDLDAQQLVVWNMGEIASVGNDKALGLFRKIILASVSMPGAFPPVYFQVKAHGKIYDEMDMDGGVTKQIFLPYEGLQNFKKAAEIQPGISGNSSKLRYKIYIIRNTFSDPIWMEVPDKIISIVIRTIDTIIKAQSMGDIYQLYAFTKLENGDFNLACIPAGYIRHDKEFFDPVEMKRLFDLGFKEASQGYHWRKTPLRLDE